MKKRLTAPELHDLLAREFANTAGDLCLACRIPMPVFRESSSGPNWRLGAMDECNSLCHSLIEDIAAKLGENYQLKR
jgi:hypothetical protein